MSTTIDRDPYLNTAEAAKRLRFVKADGSPDRSECWKYLIAKRVPYAMRGRTVLVKLSDLEASLERRQEREE